MKRASLAERTALTNDLASLPELTTLQLRERWLQFYGTPAPVRISHLLLVRAVAYRMQEIALAGLKPMVKKRLLEYLDDPANSDGDGEPLVRRPIKPGTVLLREWQGVTYTVQVIEEGVVFNGKTRRSLSEVARLITGQQWSGPRFFGLVTPKVESKSASHDLS